MLFYLFKKVLSQKFLVCFVDKQKHAQHFPNIKHFVAN